ncbi:hypothetical protein OIE64_14890 [Streptomyces brevispora]|uniref:Uncharacterized protein n=1 Tax=Streptomyces brevispora TaxID=887462 RepID=A0A561V030_9ACTN|nr:hypothetical protein [Streptomyces brevispora]TWG04939.1 hypothetical protein FHX80_113411 [Streptomyces brevispora]WSC14007.1 hypothetical protein OIE64_14890 [Streptomyces brevispora]
MTYNLLRATGAQASAFHARATTTTIRTHLVHVPARIARSARRMTLRGAGHAQALGAVRTRAPGGVVRVSG